MIKLNEQQLSAVINAMVTQINRKGAPNKMVSLEQIEVQMYNDNVLDFIPLRHVLNDLVKRGYVRYFKMDSGKLVYGIQKAKQEELFGAPQYINDEISATFEGSKVVDISEDDLPF